MQATLRSVSLFAKLSSCLTLMTATTEYLTQCCTLYLANLYTRVTNVQGRSRVRTHTSMMLYIWGPAHHATCIFLAPQHLSKKGKLELELDEFSGPSQLSGPSLKAKVHCVVNDSKGHHYFNCQIADGKTFHLCRVVRHLLLSLSSLLSMPEFCQPCEMYDKRSAVCVGHATRPPHKLHS